MNGIQSRLFFLFFLLFAYPLHAQLVEESEPNNAFSTADSLVLGKPVQGLLFPQNDDDYYKVRLTQKGLLSARVSNVAADLLIRMKLYDADFSEIDYRNEQLGQNLQMDTEICDTATYYLRVYALEQNSQLRYNFLAQVDSSQTLSCLSHISEEFTHTPAFRYYPNPARDFIFVDLMEMHPGKREDWFLSLYNNQGKLILRQKADKSRMHVHLPVLENGVYLLELQANRAVYFKKILLNNP